MMKMISGTLSRFLKKTTSTEGSEKTAAQRRSLREIIAANEFDPPTTLAWSVLMTVGLAPKKESFDLTVLSIAKQQGGCVNSRYNREYILEEVAFGISFATHMEDKHRFISKVISHISKSMADCGDVETNQVGIAMMGVSPYVAIERMEAAGISPLPNMEESLSYIQQRVIEYWELILEIPGNDNHIEIKPFSVGLGQRDNPLFRYLGKYADHIKQALALSDESTIDGILIETAVLLRYQIGLELSVDPINAEGNVST